MFMRNIADIQPVQKCDNFLLSSVFANSILRFNSGEIKPLFKSDNILLK